mmetsp:Transcript_66809/g.106211  ORF Transcript_66809/g.106211 Transcript_66809/m.106211 type:complete len:205 (-) Transcript_66809:1310-1924(-)
MRSRSVPETTHFDLRSALLSLTGAVRPICSPYTRVLDTLDSLHFAFMRIADMFDHFVPFIRVIRNIKRLHYIRRLDVIHIDPVIDELLVRNMIISRVVRRNKLICVVVIIWDHRFRRRWNITLLVAVMDLFAFQAIAIVAHRTLELLHVFVLDNNAAIARCLKTSMQILLFRHHIFHMHIAHNLGCMRIDMHLDIGFMDLAATL